LQFITLVPVGKSLQSKIVAFITALDRIGIYYGAVDMEPQHGHNLYAC